MWNVTFDQTTDMPGVGTVTAVRDGFVYSARVNTNDSEEINNFVAMAKQLYSEQADLLNVKRQIEAVIAERLGA